MFLSLDLSRFERAMQSTIGRTPRLAVGRRDISVETYSKRFSRSGLYLFDFVAPSKTPRVGFAGDAEPRPPSARTPDALPRLLRFAKQSVRGCGGRTDGVAQRQDPRSHTFSTEHDFVCLISVNQDRLSSSH